MDIYLTVFLTVISGVLVYTLGQIILKFFIEPIHEQSKGIGEIAYSLILYGNRFSNPGVHDKEKLDEASRVLRQCASLLNARTYSIKWCRFFELIKVVQTRSDIKEASKNLIGLSNSVHKGNGSINDDRWKKIDKLLNIKSHD